MLNVYIEFSY